MRGNFMLQALLALSLVIAFLPAFVKKISAKNINRENIALVAQVAAAFDAGRAFVSEEFDNFPNGIKVFSGGEFVEKLEPFGLPLGFVPVSPIGQKISLIVSKDGKNLLAVIALSGGKINDMRRAEILSRIGFWGAVLDNGLKGATGGWEMVLLPNNVGFNPDDILVRVPEDGEFSELVIRSAKDPAKNAFHTDLDMDGNSIVGARGLDAGLGNISAVSAANFRLSGIEGDRKSKNEVAKLSSNKVWFQSGDGNPLTIQRADLKTGIFSAASIANFGEASALSVKNLSVRDFNMNAGRVGFTGPGKWEVKSDMNTVNITMSADKITISSFIDATRGQDVFMDELGGGVEYASGSGIRANVVKADNIILRDQVSGGLIAGAFGPAIIEIRPSGTTVLPDVLVGGIDNDNLKIPISAADNDGKLESCRDIIVRLGGKYNSQSLMNGIVCQFVMYKRIEARIDIKKCLTAGGVNCGL